MIHSNCITKVYIGHIEVFSPAEEWELTVETYDLVKESQVWNECTLCIEILLQSNPFHTENFES